jgi:hypothetical protein
VALVERHVTPGRVLEVLVVEGVAVQQGVVEVALQVCVCKILNLRGLHKFVTTLHLLEDVFCS